jgi:hypothetical protein
MDWPENEPSSFDGKHLSNRHTVKTYAEVETKLHTVIAVLHNIIAEYGIPTKLVGLIKSA